MTKTVTNYGNTKNDINYHPEKPFWVKPILLKRFSGSPFSKVIDGVKYYFGEQTRKFYRADRFDAKFKVNKEEIKSRQYKGKTIGQDLYFTS